MFRKTLLAILLTVSGLVHAQIPISGLPNATLPLGSNNKIIVNQPVSSTVYSTRQAPLSALAPFFPSLSSHYVLQAPDVTLPQSRTLTGTTNQVIVTDGGALGNLTLSLPQSICTTCGPTFSTLTLTGVFNGFSGIFSSTLQSSGYTGTTGSFSGALSAGSFSLTTPLPATSGGTGFGSYAVGDLLAASTTTALSKLSDVAAGSYLRSGGVSTLPLWSTLTLPNAATTGDILYSTSANVIGNLPDVIVGSYLRSGGASTVPLYSTVKIPNTDALGDLWVGSSTNNMTALAGNITTTKQFLTQTGTGAVSASPAWGTIAASDLPGGFTGFANPSGLIGLTAVNGVATTATRSDATHAIDQSITPTWTNLHTFSAGLTSAGIVKGTSTGGGITPSFLASAAVPAVEWQTPGNAADQKDVQCYYNGAALIFNCTFVNDAGSAEKQFLQATRGTTTTVITVTLGNATDNPAITLNGNVTIPAPGAGVTLKVTSPATSTAAIQGTCISGTFSATTNPCISLVNTNASAQTPIDFFSNTATMTGRMRNDSAGNMTYVSFISGNHSFFTGGDSGVGTLRAAIGPGALITFPTVGTTASAANAFLDNAASNSFLRSTSSRRYKQDISTMTSVASKIIYNLRPVRFHSKASADSHTAWFYGLVAEEVAAVEPSLIVKDAQGRPDGVQYDRLQVFMLPEVQKMRTEINYLKLQVYALWLLTAFSIGFTVFKTRRV